MKTARWVCRYIFFGLALCVGLAWCGVCWSAVRQVRNETLSTAFIDLAVESIPEAREQLLRLERLQGLLRGSIFGVVAVLLLLALLITFQVLSKRVVKGVKVERVRTKRVGKKKAVPVGGNFPPAMPAGVLFCRACGAKVEGNPKFCAHCGAKLG